MNLVKSMESMAISSDPKSFVRWLDKAFNRKLRTEVRFEFEDNKLSISSSIVNLYSIMFKFNLVELPSSHQEFLSNTFIPDLLKALYQSNVQKQVAVDFVSTRNLDCF